VSADHLPHGGCRSVTPDQFIDTFWSSTVNGLVLGAVYALIALGYTLVYGVLRLINFAHSEVFMLGTFGMLVALWLLGVPNVVDGGDPLKTGAALVATLAFCLLVSAAAGGLSAVLLEVIAYRPLRRKNSPRLVFLISAIGASFVLAEAVGFFGTKKRELYPIPRVLEKKELFRVGGAQVRVDHLIVLIGALIMMVVLVAFVNKTRFGRGIRAVAQNSEAAQLMGVNVDRIVLVTFLVGGIMAGVAGFLYGLFNESARYSMGFLLGVKAFTAAVLGGIGNLQGALVGGVALGLIENYGSAMFGADQRMGSVTAFVVLVLVLMFRPSGLLGESLGRARA
jgi:branched-chain amino acid transport system permease protein